jgi:O-glycosyl hydrolase
MIGFGGALSWYSNWMTQSSKKAEIANLIFSDLGIDIVRFKNWYYPDNYPTVTSTSVMTDDNSKVQWDATNELYTLAKTGNPNVKVLLSSWGPPPSLKSNNNTRQGTLKKDGGNFMYDAYAEYWKDVLDHVPFNPDYISIQNEPTYLNAGWTTCQWSSIETSTLPDYHVAFDKVYDKIKSRPHVPVMIGPESQDVPTYAAFANKLKDRAHCGVIAYHPYNINAGTSASQIKSSLESVGAITGKPNIMTEFSDNLDWFNTAMFIQSTLLYANSSGYIYWKLIWNTPASGTDAALVSVAQGGQYTVTPFYYLIKHFSKNIDAGYRRVDVTSSNPSLQVSAFLSPDNKKVTIIVINSGTGSVDADLAVTGKTIGAMTADQSRAGEYYKPATITSEGVMSIPPASITTVVVDI